MTSPVFGCLTALTSLPFRRLCRSFEPFTRIPLCTARSDDARCHKISRFQVGEEELFPSAAVFKIPWRSEGPRERRGGGGGKRRVGGIQSKESRRGKEKEEEEGLGDMLHISLLRFRLPLLLQLFLLLRSCVCLLLLLFSVRPVLSRPFSPPPPPSPPSRKERSKGTDVG